MYHLLRASQGWVSSHQSESDLAQTAVDRALDADPTNSLALTVRGHVQIQFKRDFESADQCYREALISNPNNGLGWLFKSMMHAFRGEGEVALENSEKASLLSPLDPRRWFYDSLSATAALGAKRYDRAIELGKMSIRSNALHTSTYRALAIAQVHAGQIDNARQTVRSLMQLQPTFTVSAYRANHPTGTTEVGLSWTAALLEAGVPG